MSFGEPTDSILLKVKWADKHVLDLQNAYGVFRKTRPYDFAFHTDPHTGDRLYYVRKADPIPKELSLSIGDAINNLRCALDHSVYAMVAVANKGEGLVKGRDIKFPICQSAAEYATVFNRIKPALRDDAIKAINAIHPYKRGAGEYLCHLSALNNFDKHRLLVPTWGALQAHTMLRNQRDAMARFFRKSPEDFKGASIVPPGGRVPVEVGKAILLVPKSEVQENMQFTMNIVFAEPEIVKGNPVIETLHEMTKVVGDFICGFYRFGLFR